MLAFARAIGDDEGLPIAPPTFAAATDHFDPAFDRRPPRGHGWQAGLPASHLHVEQHFTYSSYTVHVGEELPRPWGAGRRWSKTGRSGALTFVEERTELYDAAGECIQVMRWVDVHASTDHVALTTRSAPRHPWPPPHRRHRRHRPPAPPMRARPPPPSPCHTTNLSRTQFVMYAEHVGRLPPAPPRRGHGHERGLSVVFAPGMLTMALTTHAVTTVVDRAALRELGGRFRAQVWPGDSLTATVVVDDDGVLDVRTRHADGTVVFEGHARTA